MNIGTQYISQPDIAMTEEEKCEKKPRILFVDDEIPVVLGLKRSLRHQFEVEAALGGRQALDMMKETGEFAVVVSDMRMPDMNGATFLNEVKNLFPATVRIMLTGDRDKDTPQDAINRGGVFRLLHKPCGSNEIEQVLSEALKEYERTKDQRKQMEKLFHSFENEMASPLHILLEFSDQWAADSRQPDYVRDYCRTICDKVKELSEQTNRFLTFMSLKDYQSRTSTQWLELSSLLETVADAMEGKLASNASQLTVELDPGCEEQKVEFRSIYMVLSVLLSNAVEQMPSGSKLQLCIASSWKDQRFVSIRLNVHCGDQQHSGLVISLEPLEHQLVEQLCALQSAVLDLSNGDAHQPLFSLKLPV